MFSLYGRCIHTPIIIITAHHIQFDLHNLIKITYNVLNKGIVRRCLALLTLEPKITKPWKNSQNLNLIFDLAIKFIQTWRGKKNNWYKIAVGFYATNRLEEKNNKPTKQIREEKKRKKCKLIAYGEASDYIKIQ